MSEITPKEANEILSHYTDLGYGIVIEGEDTSKIKQALLLARKMLTNGTPYNPTGDLISRSALREKISNAFIDGATKSIFKKYIDNAPTVAERPKGEWIVVKSPLSNETIVKCDKCGDEFIGNDVEDYNFCPNCGADMRGDK